MRLNYEQTTRSKYARKTTHQNDNGKETDKIESNRDDNK
jgi:hypothetical protein